MAPFPKWHPDAIDVTSSSGANPKVPVSGKPWSGGSGNRKFVLHTIEAADPWTIGWPRNWSNVRSAPHLYVNSDRYPNRDWIYQTLPFDVAGYALRDNAGEDDKYVWQVEMAGQAKNVPGYPDSFYRMVAELADFFVTEMGVPDVWRDFSCCGYGAYTDCRITRAEMNRYAGFMGHCHFGRGIDTHGDPGRLDVARVQSFMGTTPPPEPPPIQEEPPMYSMYHGDGFTDGDRPGKKSDVINFQLKLADLGHSLTTDGKYGDQTAAALAAFLGSGAVNDGRTFTGRNGYDLDQAFAALQGGDGGEHGHPDLDAKIAAQAGHDHDDRYAKADDHAALLGRYNGHHHDVPAGTVPTRRTEGPNT